MTDPTESTCRRLPYAVASAAANMARDEALLDAVATTGGPAVVRTYGWDRPSLSLGYFQRIADAEADPRWGAVPVVRRATGGGALFHDHEVTYAVVIPATHPLARPSTALYQAIHEAIAVGLRDRGVAASRRGPFPPATDGPFLCFLDRDHEDVVSGGAKVVGSAQRRRSGAVLQHGSLLLARSATTPELPGLSDLAPVGPEPTGWAAWLGEILPRALGLTPRDADFSPAEIERARELAVAVYTRAEWTRRR